MRMELTLLFCPSNRILYKTVLLDEIFEYRGWKQMNNSFPPKPIFHFSFMNEPEYSRSFLRVKT